MNAKRKSFTFSLSAAICGLAVTHRLWWSVYIIKESLPWCRSTTGIYVVAEFHGVPFAKEKKQLHIECNCLNSRLSIWKADKSVVHFFSMIIILTLRQSLEKAPHPAICRAERLVVNHLSQFSSSSDSVGIHAIGKTS